mmetsp:Transcript_23723/g.73018  ORF Transcript_23723/g.73018 Transcript_23723/m.73018 type:complete len:224 (-) Transcript_23723:10-681(-)
MDRTSWLGEAVAHGHVEGVEGVDVVGELAAVEAAAEFDDLAVLLGGAPGLVHRRSVQAETLAGLDGRLGFSCFQNVGPLLAEEVLKFGFRDDEFFRRRDGRFGGDGVVMVIDEFLLVDRLRRDVAFRRYRETCLLQALLHERDRRRRHGVRLHEHERAVHRCFGHRRRRRAASPLVPLRSPRATAALGVKGLRRRRQIEQDRRDCHKHSTRGVGRDDAANLAT